MSEFKVVLSDLDGLHRSFADGATSYEKLIPSLNPPAVDSGDGNLNKVLKALVEVFDVGHHAVVDSLNHHAEKVKSARDTFERTDAGGYFDYDGTRSLYDNMVSADEQR